MLLSRFMKNFILSIGLFSYFNIATSSHFDGFRDQVILLEFKSSNQYLHVGNDSTIKLEHHDLPENPSKYSMWYIEPLDDKNFALYSVKSKHYLRKQPNSSVGLGSRGEDAHWVVSANGNLTYSFQNKKNGKFLNGSKSDSTVSLGDEPDKWHIHQAYFQPYYRLEAFLNGFTFTSNLETLFESFGSVVFVANAIFQIDQESVGSRVQHSYEDSHTESFAWGLNETLGIGALLKATAKIPLFGGLETTATVDTTLGSHQDWTKEDSRTMSYTAWITPNSSGTYEMSCSLKMLQNATMPFTAEARLQAQAIDKEGNVLPGKFAPPQVIKEFFKKAGCHYSFSGSIDSDVSVTIPVTGNMTATYALSSVTTINKKVDG
tara:strand:- start:1664 stop:2791 length:1128 start_codon:yes stop_codon:yes gene_type:complete